MIILFNNIMARFFSTLTTPKPFDRILVVVDDAHDFAGQTSISPDETLVL